MCSLVLEVAPIEPGRLRIVASPTALAEVVLRVALELRPCLVRLLNTMSTMGDGVL